MALSDHLRELRARLLRSVLVVVVAFVVALFFYDQLLELVLIPYNDAREQLGASRSRPRRSSTTSPARCCSSSSCAAWSRDRGLEPVLALPDLGVHPARAAPPPSASGRRIFAAIAGPLFFAGVATGYYVLPKAIEVLIGFTPDGRDQPGGVRQVLLVHHPDAAGLRHRLRDPAVRGDAQPGRRGLRQGAGPLPAVDHHRHLRLRGRGHAVDRPVLDAVPRRTRCWSCSGSPRSSRGWLDRARGRGDDSTEQWADDEVSPL